MDDLNNFIKELDAEDEKEEEDLELNEQNGNIEKDEDEEKIEENKEEKLEEKDLMPNKKVKRYEDLDDFIITNADNILKFSEIINVNNISMFYIWIDIKIIGTIFMTLYFIGILEIIGLLNTLGREIKCSFDLYVSNNTTRVNDFYQNYIRENHNAPSFNMFFLSSIFSDMLINLLTFPGTILLLFVIISCIIGFGVGNFNFRTGELLTDNYTFQEIMLLILIYIGIYIFIGAIALIHLDIINKGYLLFDQQCLKLSNPEKNGYIFAYLFSMVLSSIIKMILDDEFVIKEIESISDYKRDKKYIVFIIAIYLASIISSLIFYFIYNSIFIKLKEKKDDNSYEAIKIFGYFIYCQTEGKSCKKCIDCQKFLKKCSRCLGSHNYECCRCCYCCCSEYDEAEYGQKQLCIIYKLKGICSWFGDLIAGFDMLIIVLIIYTFELINIGFNPELSDYLDKIKDEEIRSINIISFVSRLLLYFLNLCCGILYLKYFRKPFENFFQENIKNTECNLIYLSIKIFSFISILLNTIISGIFYFHENKDIYYFIPISISLSEYANIILLYYSKGSDLDVEVIKQSFAISFYKMILTVIKLFIDMFKEDKKNNYSLVLFQFIFGFIGMGVCIIYLLKIAMPKICQNCLKGKK